MSSVLHNVTSVVSLFYIIQPKRDAPRCLFVVVLFSLPLELPCFCTLLGSFTDDDQKVLCEHEGHSFPLVAKLLLFVVEKMTKVYVEQL